MRKCLLLLVLAFIDACSEQQHSSCDDCSTDDRSALPAVVTNVKLDLVEGGVRAIWPPSSGATEYEVFGASLGASGGLIYSSLGRTRATSFTDSTVATWYSYSYRVSARNSHGVTSPSKAVMIKVYPYEEWVNDWLPAPNLPFQSSEPPERIGVSGGDTGLTSTTRFLKSAVYKGCSVEGADLVEVRPAIDAIIPKAKQTFTFRVAYNTGPTEGFVSLTAMSSPEYPSDEIYYERVAIRGCGVATISFTVDVGALSDNVRASVHVFAGTGELVMNKSLKFETRAGSWMQVLSTTPVEGTPITKGALELAFEYQVDTIQDITFRLTQPVTATSTLRAGIGHATTTVTKGSGTASLTLPFEALCGGEPALLEVLTSWPTRRIGTTPSFPTFGGETFRIATDLEPFEQWFRKNTYSFSRSIAIWPLSCQGQQSVTLKAPSGWSAEDGHGQWGTTITGPSDKAYFLFPNDPFLRAFPYGSHVSEVTASFGAETITAPVHFSVVELFWKSWPSAPPGGWQLGKPYSFAITIAGPRPNTRLWAGVSYSPGGDWIGSAAFLWEPAEEAYTTEISFSVCGKHNVWLYDWLYSMAFDVSASAGYSISVDGQPPFTRRKKIDLSKGDIGPKALSLRDECGNSFHWMIAAAPSWLRFEKLTGTDAESIRFGVLTDDGGFQSFQSSPWGVIEVWVPEAEQTVYVWPYLILE